MSETTEHKAPPGTRLRNVRVDDDLWLPAKAIAAARGESLSEVIRDALAEYVDEYGDHGAPENVKGE